MRASWLEKLVPGAQLVIRECPSGLFDEGEVLEVEKVEEGVLHYRLLGGPRAAFSEGGECSVEAFGDGSLTWVVLPVVN